MLNNVVLFGWGMFDSSFARVSACSFPKIPLCPGDPLKCYADVVFVAGIVAV